MIRFKCYFDSTKETMCKQYIKLVRNKHVKNVYKSRYNELGRGSCKIPASLAKQSGKDGIASDESMAKAIDEEEDMPDLPQCEAIEVRSFAISSVAFPFSNFQEFFFLRI